jgi:hypothetical protein
MPSFKPWACFSAFLLWTLDKCCIASLSELLDLLRLEYRFLEAMPPCADDQIMMRPLAGALVFTFWATNIRHLRCTSNAAILRAATDYARRDLWFRPFFCGSRDILRQVWLSSLYLFVFYFSLSQISTSSLSQFQISVFVFVLCFNQFAGCACQFCRLCTLLVSFSFLRFGSCILLVLFALFSIISITVMFWPSISYFNIRAYGCFRCSIICFRCSVHYGAFSLTSCFLCCGTCVLSFFFQVFDNLFQVFDTFWCIQFAFCVAVLCVPFLSLLDTAFPALYVTTYTLTILCWKLLEIAGNYLNSIRYKYLLACLLACCACAVY